VQQGIDAHRVPEKQRGLELVEARGDGVGEFPKRPKKAHDLATLRLHGSKAALTGSAARRRGSLAGSCGAGSGGRRSGDKVGLPFPLGANKGTDLHRLADALDEPPPGLFLLPNSGEPAHIDLLE